MPPFIVRLFYGQMHAMSHEQSVILATKDIEIWESQGILGNFERIIGSSHENPRIASWVKFGA